MLSIEQALLMSERSRAGDLLSQVVVQLMYVGALLEAEGDRLSAAAGQSAARWRVLAALDDQPRTVATIARALGLTRQSVQRVSDALCDDGAARFRDNPADQRAALLELTREGRRALSQIQAAQARWADRLGAALGAPRLKTLRADLEKLTEALAPPSTETKGAKS
jgi:DNA-binding MarR family transcriptional regulator